MFHLESMNELGLAIAISLWIATLLILAIGVVFWKTRKKKRRSSESEEEFLSEEFSQIDDEPALATKVSSVQPIYKPYPITYEVRNISNQLETLLNIYSYDLL